MKKESIRTKVSRRIRENKRQKRNLEFARAYISRWKVERGCEICSYKRCAKALHFHHLDSSKKEYKPSNLSSKSIATFHTEIKKCVLLCSNCHAEVHAGCIDGYVDGFKEDVGDTKPKQLRLL